MGYKKEKPQKDVKDVIQAFNYLGAIDYRYGYRSYNSPQGHYNHLTLHHKKGHVDFYLKNRFFRKQPNQEYGNLFRKYGITFVYINRILYTIRKGKITKEIEIIK